jgi:RNA polymerase sigma-70 factor (ECF subfamily)
MSVFSPTRWTLVLRARGDTPEARAALAELSEAYYQPVLRFLRSEGRDEDSARELAQEFFARLLQRGELGEVDPARGRFRAYLLGAVKHFLADRRDRQRRLKRGGGRPDESLEAMAEQGAVEAADGGAAVPDTYFDRQWALIVMERALKSVEADFQRSGKEEQFCVLKVWLVGESPALSQTEAALKLGLSEGAVKVAVHRLRRRFRDCVRAEIAQTVAQGEDVDAELRYLVDVLAG